MNIWNKVLLGLIIVVLLPLAYFSMVALKTHQHWRSTAKKYEALVPVLEKKIETIKYGDPTKEGKDECLQSVRIELYKYLVNRGRIWRHCVFESRNESTILVDAKIPQKEHGIAVGTILVAFDETSIPEGGCYLGEFKVTAVNDSQIQLEPTMRLPQKSIDRILACENIKDKPVLWTLCSTMTTDMNGVFAGMKEDDLRAILPEKVVEEYLTDGKDDTVRKLRDYHILFKELDRQETMLLDEIDTATTHNKYMKGTLGDARQQQLFRQDERATLMAQLKEVSRERDASLAHLQTLKKEKQDQEAQIAQLIEDNQKTAEQIAEMQAKLLRQVDRRTAVAAQ